MERVGYRHVVKYQFSYLVIWQVEFNNSVFKLTVVSGHRAITVPKGVTRLQHYPYQYQPCGGMGFRLSWARRVHRKCIQVSFWGVWPAGRVSVVLYKTRILKGA